MLKQLSRDSETISPTGKNLGPRSHLYSALFSLWFVATLCSFLPIMWRWSMSISEWWLIFRLGEVDLGMKNAQELLAKQNMQVRAILQLYLLCDMCLFALKWTLLCSVCYHYHPASCGSRTIVRNMRCKFLCYLLFSWMVSLRILPRKLMNSQRRTPGLCPCWTKTSRAVIQYIFVLFVIYLSLWSIAFFRWSISTPENNLILLTRFSFIFYF